MRTIQKLAFVLIAVLLFASCNDKKSNLTSLIPVDAMTVSYVNTKTLAQKSEFDIFANDAVKKQLEALPLEDKQKAVFVAFQKDINSLGLNLKGNVYFFMTMDYFALAMEVNDKSKFENNLKQALGQTMDFPEILKGVNGYSIPYFGSMAWDKEKVLLVWSNYMYRGNVDTDIVLKELYSLKEENSIRSLKTFQDFEKGLKDISVYSPGISVYEKFMKQMGISLTTTQSDLFNSLSGARSISNISFEKGKIVVDATNVFDDKESEEKYNTLVSSLVKPVNAKTLDYIPSNTLMTATVGIDGANLFDKLNELGILTASNIGDEQIFLNIKDVMSNLENAVVSINSIKVTKVKSDYSDYEYFDYVPQVSVLANQKDGTDVLNLLKEKISAFVDVNTINDKSFSFPIDNKNTLTFGVTDSKILYISNDDDFNQNIVAGKKYTHDVKLPASFVSAVFGDLQQLSTMPVDRDMDMLKQFNIFESYQFVAPTADKGTGSFAIKDKSKNSLAVIFANINNLISQRMH